MKSLFGPTILNARTFLSNGANLMGVLIAASLIVIALLLLPVDSSFKAPANESAASAASSVMQQEAKKDRWLERGSTATANAPVSSTGADVLSDDWLRQRDASRDASPARIDEDVLGSP